MQYDILTAKNSCPTLRINGISIYSNYRPYEDAQRWVASEYSRNYKQYLLFGLGLGYHLKALVETTDKEKILVYYFDEVELNLFLKYNQSELWWKEERIQLTYSFEGINLDAYETQVLIPQVWLQAIGENHPIYAFLEIIKKNQIAYKKNEELMLFNFKQNLNLNDNYSCPTKTNKQACLVAAGPSLDETIEWLKFVSEKMDIYAVGAVIKKLRLHNIQPTAVIISDANSVIESQLSDIDYKGPLYYLSTANHNAVKTYKGPRYILFQKGYIDAEREADMRGSHLIETGGSVSTTLFSLLELLKYEEIFLFGQDLGFNGEQTHANAAEVTKLKSDSKIRIVTGNDGEEVKCPFNLYAFLQWFNRKMSTTSVKVYNTAKQGAKIDHVPLINKEQFIELIKK